MKAAIVFLLMSLSAVTTPAAAEWTPIGENTRGTRYFIDLATFKKGARPRAWFLTNYSERTKGGDLSDKSLREADCREERIRILADRYYTEPMGEGPLRVAYDHPGEWIYVTPKSMDEEMLRILCRNNR
jgi:hypothetical protein